MPLPAKVTLSAVLAVMYLPGGARQNALGSEPWQLVHPQARWILGVDWARARNSAAAQVVSKQLAGARGRLETSGLGLGAMVSLERIVASGISMEAGNESPKGLVVAMEGKLDRARLRKELPPGTAVEKFRGADLYVPPKARDGEPLVAVVRDHLMLIGDRESLGLILAGRGGPQDADLFGRAARLAGEADLWLVASGLEKLPGGPAQTDPLRELRSMELAISLREGLRIQASMEAATAEAAQNLAGLLQLAAAMGGGNAASAWLRQMQAEFKGNSLQISLSIPASELERGIEAGKAAVQQAGRQALESWLAGDRRDPGSGPGVSVRAKASDDDGVSHLPAPPPPPKVRTIRITGADSGPAEIQYIPPL